MTFRPMIPPLLALAACLTLAGASSAQEPVKLGLPVTCALGTDCFVQQLPDMDAGPKASDPFCGGAAYDGHDGIDIRVRSMKDVERGVPVVAVAAGTVKGVRDSMPDVLAGTPEARTAVEKVECGNGLVVDNGNGLETQYCHLRRGSLLVKSGERIEAGQPLGQIGASGLAEFPHVHLSVRQDGKKIDPITGHAVGGGCMAEGAMAGTLFSPEAAEALSQPTTAILDLGLTGAPVDYAKLVVEGAPATPPAGAPASIIWGWFANLRGGDTIAFRMVAPSGETFFEQTSDPLPGNKAAYSAFAGRKRPLAPGKWTAEIQVIRDGRPVAQSSRTIDVAA